MSYAHLKKKYLGRHRMGRSSIPRCGRPRLESDEDPLLYATGHVPGAGRSIGSPRSSIRSGVIS